MFNTELGIFCSVHTNWKELLSAEPYNLKIKEDGPYVIFNYDQIRSDFNNPIVREARGIIFRIGQWENPVCWSFNKFFNAQESFADKIDWSTAFVSEKVDGSIIRIWWDWSCGWHISTNGTIDAFVAKLNDIKMHTFGHCFETALEKYYSSFDAFVEDLDFDLTYMFELVGPYNRVVVPYNEPAIYFLGARNKYTGEEFNCSKLTAGALGMGRFKLPMQFKLDSLESCLEAVETFGWDEEGFVVCDAQFNRVKIKSPAYVMAHYARNNNVINRKHLIKVILMNEVEEFLCYAEDYREELEHVQSLMNSYFKIGTEIAKSCQRLYDIPKKTYAAWVQTLPKVYHDFAFKNYNDIKTPQAYTADWNENKWEVCLDSFEKLKEELFD